MPDVANMLADDKAKPFIEDFMIYDYWQRADNPTIRVDAKYDVGNVFVKNGELLMIQKAYNVGEYVSMAGIQTKHLDILHGTFRATFKVTGDDGGSCASFFWYRDDRTEIDVEIVTKGDSLVNDTINYTTHPSTFENGVPIPGATLRMPMSAEDGITANVYREHRFDWDAAGVKYFLDGKQRHEDRRTPALGGNLQLKLWADGNKWWSSTPSTTPVTMAVKSLKIYFNTMSDDWSERCAQAGDPKDDNICTADL